MPSWKKQGLIFSLPEAPNRSTHTQVPTVLMMDKVVRLYYACRNNGKSFPAFIDLNRKTLEVVRVQEQPVMELGKPGMFDADGIMPSCIIERDDEIWMYFIGWSALKNTARYQNEIGLAVSKDGGETFERKFDGPIIGRSRNEPGLAVMPFVMRQGGILRMYYQSGTGWNYVKGQYEPTYVIKSAKSLDGINWDRNPHQCVSLNNPAEAHSRPAVILRGGKYCMWFCYRASEEYRGGGGSYRIGYAESDDGINFKRMDALSGIDIGEEGEWDSKMVAYPAVTEIDGRLVLFYNGSRFGETGIGMAIWE